MNVGKSRIRHRTTLDFEWQLISISTQNRLNMTPSKFRVVPCPIRAFPTLISKNELTWIWTTLNKYFKVISASSVETLLKPPSAVPLVTASHSISALAVVHNELNIPEKTKKITYELICVAHRSILTRSNGSNESTKIGIKALKLVGDGIKNYQSSEKVELDSFEDGTVLKVLLEVITCAISRPNISSLGIVSKNFKQIGPILTIFGHL